MNKNYKIENTFNECTNIFKDKYYDNFFKTDSFFEWFFLKKNKKTKKEFVFFSSLLETFCERVMQLKTDRHSLCEFRLLKKELEKMHLLNLEFTKKMFKEFAENESKKISEKFNENVTNFRKKCRKINNSSK